MRLSPWYHAIKADISYPSNVSYQRSKDLYLGTFLFQVFRLGAERLGPRTVGLSTKLNDERSIVGRFSNGGST